MKLNIVKSSKLKFNPLVHWYIFLCSVSVLFLIIVAYSTYSFLYIKNQINLIETEAQGSIQNPTSDELLEKNANNDKLMKDVKNLNSILDEYQKKEIEYRNLVKYTLPVTLTSTTTFSNNATSTVATSTQ